MLFPSEQKMIKPDLTQNDDAIADDLRCREFVAYEQVIDHVLQLAAQQNEVAPPFLNWRYRSSCCPITYRCAACQKVLRPAGVEVRDQPGTS
jgi:hypothetical protein